VEGGAARAVLSKGISLDFHPREFRPGQFASTGLHHTPVLVHCIGGDVFHVYAMRTFATSVWDWLRDAALEFST
jgi:sarcosine oxidase subunit gamma